MQLVLFMMKFVELVTSSAACTKIKLYMNLRALLCDPPHPSCVELCGM